MISLGTKLRNFRLAKEFSQKKVADILDIKQPTYSNWEKDSTSPSAEYLTKLAEIFDIPVQDFFSQANYLVQNQENKDEATGFNVGVTEQMLEKILAPLHETIQNQNAIIQKLLEQLASK
jgi:transcriptional regulator with XRE-family HTH domain